MSSDCHYRSADKTKEESSPASQNTIITLSVDKYGSKVVLHLLDKTTRNQRKIIVKALKGNVFGLSLHPYGKDVIVRTLLTVQRELRPEMLAELCDLRFVKCAVDRHGSDVVLTCMKQFNQAQLHFVIEALQGQVGIQFLMYCFCVLFVCVSQVF